jgi:hypothetical protein
MRYVAVVTASHLNELQQLLGYFRADSLVFALLIAPNVLWNWQLC